MMEHQGLRPHSHRNPLGSLVSPTTLPPCPVLLPNREGKAAGPVAHALLAEGVEIVEIGKGEPEAVAAHLNGLGLLSALWMVEPSSARLAVRQGVIQEMAVRARLEEADELGG